MQIVNKKNTETKNVFYGVDVNDKEAVQKEYARLQRQHRLITLLAIVVLGVLAVVFFDFYRVNYIGGKPIFAVSKKVEKGTLFSGIGYKVLYCENGERYVGSVLYKSCNDTDTQTFITLIQEKLIKYAEDNKILDRDNLVSLTINEIERDSENEEEGFDYLIDVSYECKDGTDRCFKSGKEFPNTKNNKMYVKINRYNEVYELLTFKDSGAYAEKLNQEFSQKARDYYIANNLMTDENVHSFEIKIVSNNGKYKFRGTEYADSYLVAVTYLCNDNGNTCVEAFDKEDQDNDYSNLTYYATMLLDQENNIMLIGPKEYLEIG